MRFLQRAGLSSASDVSPRRARVAARCAVVMVPIQIACAALAPLGALAQAAPLEGWQALRASVVATPAAGLPYATALQRAGMGERAAQLRLSLLAAHVQALNGTPWPAPRALGEVFDETPSLPPAMGDSALAQSWRLAFNGAALVEWDRTMPAEMARAQGSWTPIAPGAWTSLNPPRVRAAVTLSHRMPTPVTLPHWTLQLRGAAGQLFMTCSPLASSNDAVAAGERRAFVCRADAADRHGLLSRAAQGRLAAGESMTLLPSHFESTAAWTALAEAIGSATPFNVVGWVERLAAPAGAAERGAGATSSAAGARPPGAGAAASAAAGTRSTSAAPTSGAIVPPQPPPPATWRVAFAVTGSLAVLWLFARLVFGRLDDEAPGRTLWRSLPGVVGLLALGAAVGSPWGQAAIAHASGAGLRDAALALGAASERAPSAWRLPAMAARYGYVVMAAGAGVLFFMVERLLIVRGFSGAYVKGLSLLAQGALFLVLAAGMGPPTATPLYFALLFYAGAMLATSVVVSWLLHSLFEQLDDAGLGLFSALRRTLVGTLDFSGTAVRAELWAWLLLALVGLLAVQAWRPTWVPPAAAVLAVPLPALLVRCLRGLSDRDRRRLVRSLARETVERAERVARRRS